MKKMKSKMKTKSHKIENIFAKDYLVSVIVINLIFQIMTIFNIFGEGLNWGISLILVNLILYFGMVIK